ncbi:hypothetical protein PYW08_012388 [Mythimna loreyi]|uniref:Uncharacterized protein n=1 Tax=Mythimna loreyi TaxID=667449 RepID=A0ACC2Q2T3_9NEOP|nr:hypothetical protein PYW08_012388 [Mythimna loreyi]
MEEKNILRRPQIKRDKGRKMMLSFVRVVKRYNSQGLTSDSPRSEGRIVLRVPSLRTKIVSGHFRDQSATVYSASRTSVKLIKMVGARGTPYAAASLNRFDFPNTNSASRRHNG